MKIVASKAGCSSRVGPVGARERVHPGPPDSVLHDFDRAVSRARGETETVSPLVSPVVSSLASPPATPICVPSPPVARPVMQPVRLPASTSSPPAGPASAPVRASDPDELTVWLSQAGHLVPGFRLQRVGQGLWRVRLARGTSVRAQDQEALSRRLGLLGADVDSSVEDDLP